MAWHNEVAELGCIVTGRPNPTLHHIHSGSVARAGYVRGTSQRGVSDWLVIPLAAELHCAGQDAIDGSIGVSTWEAKHGAQLTHMDEVCRRTGNNAWDKAGFRRDPWRLDSSELTQD